jgi:hypothetical protein
MLCRAPDRHAATVWRIAASLAPSLLLHDKLPVNDLEHHGETFGTVLNVDTHVGVIGDLPGLLRTIWARTALCLSSATLGTRVSQGPPEASDLGCKIPPPIQKGRIGPYRACSGGLFCPRSGCPEEAYRIAIPCSGSSRSVGVHPEDRGVQGTDRRGA